MVIAGANGFLGRSLAETLSRQGVSVGALVRCRTDSLPPGVDQWIWDGRTLGDWGEGIDGAWGVVNLVGRSVDCRKTDAGILWG